MSEKRTWLKGDTHLHTVNSDGVLTTEQLIKALKKKGLDWAIITDHNYPAADAPYYDEDLLIIQGEEVTSGLGHFNVWGIKMPVQAPYNANTPEGLKELFDTAKQAGGTVSINHPFCKNCTWHLPLDEFEMDCVEVWNAPMHIDDLTNRDWWHRQLLNGRKIAAVGGSDYHKDYVVTDFLAMPTTFVYAKSNTQEDILEALRGGHSFISQGPNKTSLILTCGDAFMGQTVNWQKGIKVKLQARKLKRGHRLRVFNNNTLLYDEKVKKSDLDLELEVLEKGFVRAEITYEYKHIALRIYKLVLLYAMPKDIGLKPPPFIYAFTNPIYFE
ncbi:MAG TPA: CehA/McbA family metallohydrolase [Clostridiales bacterium]|nr:CehA/McbA family metallohydrolase [Clostridiales bacterium]